MSVENKPPILHICVVGFHHKQGCQVEFSYPPLVPDTTGRNECPSGWKYLPTLALPDGSHNFVEDTVFFNLPSLADPAESVYGVSCYRQIPVEKLKIRTADVTRSTVQKSVCILSRLPIYGYIEVKLSLIADTFFDQGDFSRTEILVKVYNQVNACLLDEESLRPLRHFHVGLSLRDIVLNWKHKTLILFKLFLLQRRVVCFGSPVRSMCALILGISSLIPRLLEKGFQEVACVRTSRPLSPMPDFTDSLHREAAQLKQENSMDNLEMKISPDAGSCAEAVDEPTLVSSAASAAAGNVGSGDSSPTLASSGSTADSMHELNRADSTEGSSTELGRGNRSNSLTRESSVEVLGANLAALSAINPDEYRAPISIFASGNLCLPYLSLPYLDLLTDPSVLSYVIGTSNVLFQQKRHLADVFVDIENNTISATDQDPELRKQLVLSTEDLRFTEYLMKHVQSPKEEAEGSEHWIREQFQGYMLALLRAAVSTDATPKDCDHFNAHFIQAFKRTQCFQEWYDVRPDAEFFLSLPAGHPFAGTLSVADMKLKIAQTMQNSESGRKINEAVNQTSRAVGGAITQAKGAFSNWWSSITTAAAVVNIAPTVSNGGGDSIIPPPVQQQPQEIAVTFQNRKNIDEIEIGVSIQLDTPQKKISNASSSNSSDKLVDSAEELQEDGLYRNQNRTPTTTALNDSKELTLPTPPVSTAAGTAGTSPVHRQHSEGIVEIGKEAAALEAKSQESIIATQQKEAVAIQQNNSSTSSAERRSSGEVFIV